MIQAVNPTISNKQVTFGQNQKRKQGHPVAKYIAMSATSGALAGAAWHGFDVATKNASFSLRNMGKESLRFASYFLIFDAIWALTKKMFNS